MATMAGMNPMLQASGASVSSHKLPTARGESAVGVGPLQDIVEHGLSNEGGSNHCFLNVAIQTFWNLPSFRQRFAAAPEHNHDLASTAPSQGASSSSASSPNADGSAGYCSPCQADPLDSPESCCFCALKSVFTQYQFSEVDTLPPDSLRTTMANTYTTSGRFQLGEMEDATETIEALLDILHLSHMYAPKDALAALAEEPHHEFPTRERRTSRVEAELAKVSGANRVEEASNFACQPPCIAHEVFGIEYVDLPLCTFCGASFDPESIVSSFMYRIYVAELLAEQGRPDAPVSREETPSAVSDLSDQVCRATARWTSKRPEMQTAMRSLCQRPVDKKCTECNSRNTIVLERWLTRRPYTFMVSLIWPTSMPTRDSLWSVISSIQPSMQMEQIFKTDRGSPSKMGKDVKEKAPQSSDSSVEKYPLYLFRGLICYYGMHYVAFFFCWARKKWILFDDTCVREEKDWSSVASIIMNGQYVPTILLFENCYDDAMTDDAVEELFRQMRELEDPQSACTVA